MGRGPIIALSSLRTILKGGSSAKKTLVGFMDINLDDLVKSPVSHEATEITKIILNILNAPFFVPLWLRVKIRLFAGPSTLER